MNIVDQILFQCRYQPPAAAMCAPGKGIGLISYARLERFIHNISRRLLRLGLSPGSVVATLFDDAIFEATITLALMRLGMVSVSARGQKLPAELKVEAVICDKNVPFTNAGRVVLADPSWTTGEGKPLAPQEIHQGTPDDVCRIILTSGTTGNPKGVAITQRMLAARVGRHFAIFGPRLPSCARIFVDMMLTTSLGFQFLIYGLSRGGTVFFVGDSFQETMEAVEKYGVQCWLASPAGLANLAKYFDQFTRHQSRLELVLSAGDMLAKSLSDRIRARVCSHVVSIYGSTETSMAATAPIHAIADIRGAVGYVTPGVSVQVVSDSGRPLPHAQQGIIRVRSDFAVQGYVGDPAGSQQMFRDGWFYPGDLGALTPDNVLLVTGRERAVMNLGGEKINPEAIELVVAEAPGVQDVGVFSIANDLGIETVWAAVVVKPDFDDERLRAHCGKRLASMFVPSRFLRVSKVPRNQMGKIDRPQLIKLAKSHGEKLTP